MRITKTLPVMCFLLLLLWALPASAQTNDEHLIVQQKLILEVKELKETNQLLQAKTEELDKSNQNYQKLVELFNQKISISDQFQTLFAEKEKNYLLIVQGKDIKIVELQKQIDLLNTKLNKKQKSSKLKHVIIFIAGVALGFKI